MRSTTPVNTLRRVPLFKDLIDDLLLHVAEQGSWQIVRGDETNGLVDELARSMREILR